MFIHSLRTRIALLVTAFVLVALANSVLALFFYSRYSAVTGQLFSGDFVRIDRANELLLEAKRLEATGVRLMWTAEFGALEGLFDQLLEHVDLLNRATFELVRGEPAVDGISLYRATQNVLASANLVFQLRSSQLSGSAAEGGAPPDGSALNGMYRQLLSDLRELTGLTNAIQESMYSRGKHKLDDVAAQNLRWVWISWALAGLTVLLAAILISWFLGRQLVGRLSVIGEAVAEQATGKKVKELPVRGRDEVAAVARSIEGLLQVANQMAQREEQLRDFATSAADFFWECNREFCFTHLSPAFFDMSGMTPQAVIGKPITSLISDARFVLPVAELRKARCCMLKNLPFRSVFIEYHPPGAAVGYYRLTGVPHREADGSFAGFRGTAIDVTGETLERRRLEVQALTDPLTGVHNQRRFMELCAQEFARWLRTRRPLSLAILRVDGLRAINDFCGHRVGDETLVRFARVVEDMVRQADIFGRLGGNEFALLIPDTGVDAAAVFLERIRAAARGVSPPGGPDVALGIGAVEVSRTDTGIQALLKRADQALRRDRNPGYGRRASP